MFQRVYLLCAYYNDQSCLFLSAFEILKIVYRPNTTLVQGYQVGKQ